MPHPSWRPGPDIRGASFAGISPDESQQWGTENVLRADGCLVALDY